MRKVILRIQNILRMLGDSACKNRLFPNPLFSGIGVDCCLENVPVFSTVKGTCGNWKNDSDSVISRGVKTLLSGSGGLWAAARGYHVEVAPKPFGAFTCRIMQKG